VSGITTTKSVMFVAVNSASGGITLTKSVLFIAFNPTAVVNPRTKARVRVRYGQA
jgi:hypothetical protein